MKFFSLTAMDLPGKHELARTHEAGHDRPVLDNIFMAITDAETDIQTIEGRWTISGMAGKDPVIDPTASGQISKSKK